MGLPDLRRQCWFQSPFYLCYKFISQILMIHRDKFLSMTVVREAHRGLKAAGQG